MTSAESAMPANDAGRSAAETIAEADVVQLAGDRLYALSRYAGLAVVDVSNPDALKVVARRPMSGTPFEMYLLGDVLVTMASDFGHIAIDDVTGDTSWVQSSRIEALDVSDLSNMKSLGAMDLAGALSDSRVVGDVLYVVTFEDGGCWDCRDVPTTIVSSFSLADPSAMPLVDQLAFSEPSTAWSYGYRRSIAVNDQRMYVAGIEWDGTGVGRSTIQVVGLDDGALTLGASVEAAGQIESRWQMDEHDGVLRVVSQPGTWETDAPPRVQTFGVASNELVMPLADMPLVLPKPERLRAVRFDGDRAYAITAEQTDPLFTIDLTMPAAPQQLGELEMPGWIHHIEPRGDRLITLGFDQSDKNGSLHLSLFDVSTLSKPVMLAREAFGGDWSELPEDQDRIHKAIEIVDELGMILVPYASYDYEMGCGSGKTDAIQIFDWQRDDLARRGKADTRGQARRAVMHNSRLLATSDFGVRSYDLSNRDAPRMTSAVGLAAHVDGAVSVGAHVARLPGSDWSAGSLLEIVTASQPGDPDPVGVVDLAPVLSLPGAPSKDGYSSCPMGTSGARLFANPPYIYVAAPIDWQSTRVVVVDASVPSSPIVKGHVDVAASAADGWGWGYYGGMPSAGSQVVQIGNALVFSKQDEPVWPAEASGRAEGSFKRSEPQQPLVGARLLVVDLSNPAAPIVAASHELPEAISHTPLVVSGDIVMTSRYEPVFGQPGKVRFWLDRVWMKDPNKPLALPSINVPGSLVSYDAPSNNALFLDYVDDVYQGITPEQCWELYGGSSYDDTPRGASDERAAPPNCYVTHRVFKAAHLDAPIATLLDELQVADGSWIGSVFAGDDRVFATESGPYWPLMEPAMVATDAMIAPNTSQRVLVLGGIRGGALAAEWIDVGSGAQAHAARGRSLVMSSWSPPSLLLLNADDIEHSVVTPLADLPSSPYSVTVDESAALCAMGPYGLASVAMPTDR